MKNQILTVQSLEEIAFQPFGDILQIQDEPTVMINQGNCARYSDIAQLDFADGEAGISVFHAKPYTSPLTLAMLERHPKGSQAFIPLSELPFLVIVAEDHNGTPGVPTVFLSNGYQGVNYHRNTWHGVLTPVEGNGLFAVVDRVGMGKNLEEYWLEPPYLIKY
ncbi:MAG: ureidoglycolate lyase [Granulosicoccus sp.]|jgi:ureidoglycolate lyase